jgi:hypothetical protein
VDNFVEDEEEEEPMGYIPSSMEKKAGSSSSSSGGDGDGDGERLISLLSHMVEAEGEGGQQEDEETNGDDEDV